MNKTKNGINGMSVEDLKIMDEIIDAKLQDAEIPGFQAEFDPRGLKSNGTKTYAKEHTCPPMLGSVA